MLIRDILQQIEHYLSIGVPSDDSRYSRRWLYNEFLAARAFVIGKEYANNRQVMSSNAQSICVKLDKVLKCGAHSGIIATPIYGITGAPLILELSSDTSIYSYVDPSTFNHAKSNRILARKGVYTIDAFELKLYAKKIPDTVQLTYVPYDPISAYLRSCEQVDKCISYLDLRIPMDSKILEQILQIMKQNIMQYPYEDKINQSSTDLQQGVRQVYQGQKQGQKR